MITIESFGAKFGNFVS